MRVRWEVARWFMAAGVALVVLLISATSLAGMLGGVQDAVEESGQDDAVSTRLDDLAEDPIMTSTPPNAEVLDTVRREECDEITGPLAVSVTRTLVGVPIDQVVYFLGLASAQEGWRAAPQNTIEEELGAETVYERRFSGNWTARVAVYPAQDDAVAVAGYISEPRPCPLTTGSID